MDEPVIRLQGIPRLSLVRTVDCWPEYWDLEPVRRIGDTYEFEPKNAISRNGYRFEDGKFRTTFVAYFE